MPFTMLSKLEYGHVRHTMFLFAMDTDFILAFPLAPAYPLWRSAIANFLTEVKPVSLKDDTFELKQPKIILIQQVDLNKNYILMNDAFSQLFIE